MDSMLTFILATEARADLIETRRIAVPTILWLVCLEGEQQLLFSVVEGDDSSL
jgi:hypothetical protein